MSEGLRVMSHATQFNEFLKFATENKDGALAKLDGMTKAKGTQGFVLGNDVRQISLSDKDSKLGIFHWWRTSEQKSANIQTQRLFYDSVKGIFGKLKQPIPQEVLKALGDDSFRNSGSPLSARRILAVADAMTLSFAVGKVNKATNRVGDEKSNLNLGTKIENALSKFTYKGSLKINSESFEAFRDGMKKLNDDLAQKYGESLTKLDEYNKELNRLNNQVLQCGKIAKGIEDKIKEKGETVELKQKLNEANDNKKLAEAKLTAFNKEHPKESVDDLKAMRSKMNKERTAAETQLKDTFYTSEPMKRLSGFIVGLAKKIEVPTTSGDSDFHAQVGQIAVTAYFNTHHDDFRRLVKSVPKEMMDEAGKLIIRKKDMLTDKMALEDLTDDEMAKTQQQVKSLQMALGVSGALAQLLK